MEIQRWALRKSTYNPNPEGNWVRYTDHLAAVAAARDTALDEALACLVSVPNAFSITAYYGEVRRRIAELRSPATAPESVTREWH